jgi:hypothetical protein
MHSMRDDILDNLRDKYPEWEIWYIVKAVGGEIWCARLKNNHKALINTDTSEELDLEIAVY